MKKDVSFTGLQAIAEQEAVLEELQQTIPPEHRGLLFERVLGDFNSQENTRRLELAFALVWAERNCPRMSIGRLRTLRTSKNS